MSRKPLAIALLAFFTVTSVVPIALLVAPKRASASPVSCAGGLIGSIFGSAAPVVSNILGIRTVDSVTGGNTGLGAGGAIGACFNDVVLKPLARSLIRGILQSVTASVIDWINGRTNGTGQPSFVRNLSRHLQSVGDAIALPFINQVRRVLNPAFANAIASSLLMNYARQSSVGGFLIANQGTLAAASPNPTAFLAGDWRQGGTSAWLALSTKNENNPYVTYPIVEDKLKTLIAQGESSRKTDLANSGGFLSWCGPSSGSSGPNGINPGATCMSNGVAGNIQTPGTVIRDYTKDVLGAEWAQLINPSDIDGALAAIFGAALNQGIRSVLGGSGLFGASTPSSVRPEAVTGALRASATNNSATITSASTAADAAIARANDYAAAWNTIASAANTALPYVNSVKNNPSCTSQSGAADTALSQINQVLAQSQQASSDAQAEQTLANKVLSEASAGPSTQLTTDMQTLSTMVPQAADVTRAQSDARTGSGGLADQMNAITTTMSGLVTRNCQ